MNLAVLGVEAVRLPDGAPDVEVGVVRRAEPDAVDDEALGDGVDDELAPIRAGEAHEAEVLGAGAGGCVGERVVAGVVGVADRVIAGLACELVEEVVAPLGGGALLHAGRPFRRRRVTVLPARGGRRCFASDDAIAR